MTAIDWGWSVDETAARLMQESEKAKTKGREYADLTARNAAAAIARHDRRVAVGESALGMESSSASAMVRSR
jgi:hypothetical protein